MIRQIKEKSNLHGPKWKYMALDRPKEDVRISAEESTRVTIKSFKTTD
jgi:hypothetical protein